MPPVVVLPEDSLRSLPPSSFVLALCVWNGYAEVGNMIVCARAYYTDPDFLASEAGLARHVSTLNGDKLRTRLQHACGDLNHERGLARVQQFLSAPGVKKLTPDQLINVGDYEENPLYRAATCTNIPLLRLLVKHGAVCTIDMIECAIGNDRDDIVLTLIEVMGEKGKVVLRRFALEFTINDASGVYAMYGGDVLKFAIKAREFIRKNHAAVAVQ